MAGTPPLPNIPLLAASCADLPQGMTSMVNDMTNMSISDMTSISSDSNETPRFFAYVGAIDIDTAAQLAQINSSLHELANTLANNHQDLLDTHQVLLNTHQEVEDTHQILLNTMTANHQTAQANHEILLNTITANHQTAQANHEILLNTVTSNHQTAQANHRANHQTVQADHQTVMQLLADIQTKLDLQPMRVANATTASNANLVGPTLAPLVAPHPISRDALLSFTVMQCSSSVAAFTTAGYTLNPLPDAPSVQDRRTQLATFLGVNL